MEVQSQEGPAAAQGSHPNTTSTDPMSLQRANTPGAVHLVTFYLEREALTSTETRSALDASCKVQEAMTWMHNLAHRPNLAMEETCQVTKPSARRTLQFSIHRFALSWSQGGKGSRNHNISCGKLFLCIMNLHWGDHCFSYGPSGTSNGTNKFSM